MTSLARIAHIRAHVKGRHTTPHKQCPTCASWLIQLEQLGK